GGPEFRSDLQARSKASPIMDVTTSSNDSCCIGLLVIVTSRNNERERKSVSRSPRLEAISVIGHIRPPKQPIAGLYRPPFIILMLACRQNPKSKHAFTRL